MDKIRRHDIDWLRVIVFGLLIFYHVGMFFVPWGWHVKNNEIIGWIRYPMLFLNQWRLPILFVISGMGTAYALSFRSGGQFASERAKRLGIPLVFGMLFIVPPQVYFERLSTGDFNGSYLEFLVGPAFTTGVYPIGNISWHHLWFLPYLLVFSIILIPVFLYLRRHPDHSNLQWWRRNLAKNSFYLYIFILPLYLCESLMEPLFPIQQNLIADWFNFTNSLSLFLFGFFLISLKDAFWQAVDRIKKYALIIGVISFSGLMVIWLIFEDSILIHFTEAFLKVTNLWSWILVIFGYAAVHLNKPSRILGYCNQSVYPFYILHQTITVAIGFYVMNVEIHYSIKMLVMIIGTFGVSWLVYEFLIRRIPFLHPFFGLKKGKS